MNNLIPKQIHLDIDDLRKAIKDFKITDAMTLQQSVVYTANLKRFAALLKDLEENSIKPYKEPLQAIQAKFKPYKDVLKQSEAELKVKMVEYDKIKEIEEAEKIKNQSRADDPFTLVVDEQEEKVDGMYFRKKFDIEIIDKSKIPSEYLMPDIDKLEQAVLKEHKNIPGVKIKITKIAVVKK